MSFLIVDQYQRFTVAKQAGIPLNAEYEAQTLRLLVKPMGREYRCIALISRDDLDGLNAYQRANYEIITYNGDHPQKIREFLIQFIKQLDEIPPEHLVLVSLIPCFKSCVTVRLVAKMFPFPFELLQRKYHKN